MAISDNLIPNPDFETNLDDWEVAAGSLDTFARSSDWAAHGNWSARVTTDESTDLIAPAPGVDAVPCVAGQKVNARLVGNVLDIGATDPQDPDTELRVIFYDAGGVELEDSGIGPDFSGTGRQTVAARDSAPVDTAFAALHLALRPDLGSVDLYIDAAELYIADPGDTDDDWFFTGSAYAPKPADYAVYYRDVDVLPPQPWQSMGVILGKDTAAEAVPEAFVLPGRYRVVRFDIGDDYDVTSATDAVEVDPATGDPL